MSSNREEKQLFAQRLKNALKDRNHPISPTYLSNEFNNRYDGQPISVQSANNWLLGKAIPNQDKLSILSLWLNVSAQWLRFGEETASIESSTIRSNADQLDLDYFMKYKRLPLSQKKLLQNLIDVFSNLDRSKK
jgi:HTH-type transcriptional regulator, cell division transcriptional repressor